MKVMKGRLFYEQIQNHVGLKLHSIVLAVYTSRKLILKNVVPIGIPWKKCSHVLKEPN